MIKIQFILFLGLGLFCLGVILLLYGQSTKSDIRNPFEKRKIKTGFGDKYFPFRLFEKAEVIITNVLGRMMVQKEYTGENILVNTSTWEKGIYFVSITQNKNRYNFKSLVP